MFNVNKKTRKFKQQSLRTLAWFSDGPGRSRLFWERARDKSRERPGPSENQAIRTPTRSLIQKVLWLQNHQVLPHCPRLARKLNHLQSNLNRSFVMLHFRKEATIFFLGISCHASKIHEQINSSSSDSFFCCPPAVNSWIPSASYCIHLFLTLSLNGLFRETSSGWRSEVNPPGITARFVFSLAIAAFTLSVTWASNTS